jgi:fructoselysine-6-P-deglycase FrlB-like protein
MEALESSSVSSQYGEGPTDQSADNAYIFTSRRGIGQDIVQWVQDHVEARG